MSGVRIPPRAPHAIKNKSRHKNDGFCFLFLCKTEQNTLSCALCTKREKGEEAIAKYIAIAFEEKILYQFFIYHLTMWPMSEQSAIWFHMNTAANTCNVGAKAQTQHYLPLQRHQIQIRKSHSLCAPRLNKRLLQGMN